MKKLATKNKLKEAQGITLVALVVTIVVLIILSVVSVSMVISKDGIIGRAGKAKEHQANAEVDEVTRTDTLANAIEAGISGGIPNTPGGGTDTDLPPITPTTPAGDGVKIPDEWKGENVNPPLAISDGDGREVPLPEGFYYVGGNREEGLVISDIQGDTMDAEGPSSGNQFVWIPVDNPVDFIRYNFNSSGVPTGNAPPFGEDASSCDEPHPSADLPEVGQHGKMYDQTRKYGGFYIGRFEAGINTPDSFRTGWTDAETVVCKRGVVPYNWAPWGSSAYNMGGNESPSGAAYLATTMYPEYDNSKGVVSTLCYGVQWDAICKYIGGLSKQTGTIKSGVSLTGRDSDDNFKNIYDLAGNCYEWTMEACNENNRVYRGGCYNAAYAISVRTQSNPTVGDDKYSFRPALYIKD